FSFFFSSRRRHTRFSRDWSSDVCSSDLSLSASARRALMRAYQQALKEDAGAVSARHMLLGLAADADSVAARALARALEEGDGPRSEERRVGKGCRSRGRP